MGFVKGTDGIASTLLNSLEGSVGDVALDNITAINLLTGTMSASANVTGGNVLTGGVISATSNIDTAAAVLATGNINGGNINTAGLVTATGNITGGNVLTGGLISVSANVTGGNLITSGNITGNTAGFAIGYRDIPQVSLSANATIATADAGKHFYSTSASNLILTIANNASQGFQTGAAITIVNQGSGNITVAQGSGVTLYLAGNSSSGNRTISTFGMATCIKVATNTWFINGTGVS